MAITTTQVTDAGQARITATKATATTPIKGQNMLKSIATKGKMKTLSLLLLIGIAGAQQKPVARKKVVKPPPEIYVETFETPTNKNIWSHSEPLDVPAIEGAMREVECSPMQLLAAEGSPHYSCWIMGNWACVDRTRILEHDEQNPPKYWCRKVQP